MKRKNTRLLSISIIPILALLFFVKSEPLSNSSEEFVDPCNDPIVATGAGGVSLCWARGEFIDFHDLYGPSNVTNASWEWESLTLPGFNTNTGSRILRTYWVPPSTPLGCHKVTVQNVGGGVCPTNVKRTIWIRITANPSDPCTACETGPGGPGGPDGEE